MVIMGVLLAGAIIVGVTILQNSGILPNYNTLFKGTLIVRMHDPPNLPSGASDVFLSYDGLSIHSTTNGGSWVNLNQSGTVDLASLLNVTKTIGTAKIYFGIFDFFRMHVSSATITYYGKNYTAVVEGGNFVIGISGGKIVIDGEHSAVGAILDFSPTIMIHPTDNSSSSIPSFVFVPNARAFVVPSDQLQANDAQIGNEDNISSEQWLITDQQQQFYESSLIVTVLSLTNSDLSVNVSNTGNESAIVETLFIALNDSSTIGEGLSTSNSSVVFAVLSNGTLVPLIDDQSFADLQDQLDIGYNISSGSSVNFSYYGSIPPIGVSNNSMISYSASDNMTSDVSNQTTIGVDNGTTTITTTSDTTNSSATDYSDPVIQWSDLQIIPGETYLVGVVACDLIATTTYTP
jgi:hypothetical protein